MKEAIILLNMGGPNNLHEVEMFLKNMFNDPNILTMKNNLLRRFIGGTITLFRAEAAQEIYRELGGKSPIVGHTKNLVADTQNAFDKCFEDNTFDNEVYIDYAMRYTPPFADEVIAKLKEKNIEKVYLLPLYPQYSTTTTKSSLEDLEEALQNNKMDTLVVEIKHYFENELYNRAIIERIKEKMQEQKEGENSTLEYRDFDLIFSAHGLPQKIVDAGDPYQRHIERHVEILKEMIKKENLGFFNIHLAYQSKVGPMAWLKPSLEEKLETVRNRGVIIYPIAFTIDNSETDFELEVEYREVAEKFGFTEYKVAKCVNNHPLFIEALKEIYTKMKH